MGNPPVIDMHVHLAAMAESNGAFVSRSTKRNPKFLYIGLKYGWRGNAEEFDRRYAERVAREVRESKTTDRAVMLALDGIYDEKGKLDLERTKVHIPNEYCRRVCSEHEEFLYGASVNPDRADALDELERVKADGAVLIKWLPNSQDFDPENKKYIPFYRKLADLKLLLLTHTGYEHCIEAADQMYGDPKRLRTALDEGATVIAAHAGSSGMRRPVEFFDDYLPMYDEYPNLYGDLGAITGITRYGYIPAMLKHPGFMERHLQATDYPAPPVPFLFLKALGFRRCAALSLIRNIFDRDVETKRALGFPDDILHNAARLLGML